MTAITFTRSTGSAGVMTVDLELELYAGTLNDSTAWLDGGAAADSYPGALDGFAAKNANTTDADAGLKLVVGTCTLVQNNNAFTIGGASKVHAIVIGGSGVAATSCSVDAGLGTNIITFACEGNLTGSTGFMAIVS